MNTKRSDYYRAEYERVFQLSMEHERKCRELYCLYSIEENEENRRLFDEEQIICQALAHLWGYYQKKSAEVN